MAHRHAIHDLLLTEWQRPERLGEHLDLFHADRDLTRPRTEQWTGYADHVANVEEVERGEEFFAELILPEVQLNPAALVAQVREDRFAMRAPSHDATGHAHAFALRLVPLGQQGHRVDRVVRALER